MRRLIISCLFVFLIFAFSASSYAGLLISPLQVVIDGRERYANIVLVNTTQNEATYRMQWEQLIQVQDKGGYILDADEEAMHLQDFAIFTPRQITLKPQEKQTVRVAVRRPADLPVGEYKSHLKFQIIDDGQVSNYDFQSPEPGKNEVRIGARVLASHSIPVVYRVGEHDVNISILDPSFSINPKSGKMAIELPVERSGTHGVIGLIEAYHAPHGGAEELISTLGNSSLYPEITRRYFKMITNVNGLAPGNLRFVFKTAEGDASEQEVIAERVIPISN